MDLSRAKTRIALIATIVVLGCTDRQSATGPGDDAIAFAKPTCPGHPSCGDPPAPAGNATTDLTGDVTTSSSQDIVISKDSRNSLAGSGGGDDFDILDALSLFAAAGSPTPAALGGCVTDPPDLASTDPAAVQDLIDRLTDAEQSRTFRFTVNRKDPSNMTGRINQSWVDDVDGRQYRTRITGTSLRPGNPVVVTSPAPDEYVYEQGSIVSWDMSTGGILACPNGGSVTMRINR